MISIKNPRRTIGGLVTILAATGVAVGSGASFTSHSANPTNTFTSGTLLHSNSKSGVAIVTGANLKPGDVKTGEVTIKNTGTLKGDFKLSETNRSNPFTAGSLTLAIQDVTNASSPVSVYSGDLGAVAAGGISLGAFAPNESHTYRYTVTLQTAAPNADQGKTATADYEWDVVPSA